MTTATPTKKERRDQARQERIAREQAEAAWTARRRRFTRLGAVLGAAAVVVVILVAVSSSGGGSASTSSSASSSAVAGTQASRSLLNGIPQKGLTLGNANAPVRVLEFADLQCPFCAQYSTQVLPTLVEKYVKTGKVKMELRLIPILGEDSRTAANWAAAAALQNKTWQFSEAFFADQGQEGSGYVNEDFLTSVAEQVDGLNVDEVKEQQGSEEAGAIVNQSTRQASTAGVSGTPTFRIGRTNQTLEALEITALEAAQFEQQIDRLLGQGGG